MTGATENASTRNSQAKNAATTGDTSEAANARKAGMTEDDLAAIMTAVTLAKDLQIRNAQSLRTAMIGKGFTEIEAGRALVFWGDYERAKTTGK